MLIALCILLLTPLSAGMLFADAEQGIIQNLIFSWLTGFVLLLTLFEILYLPALFLHLSFHSFSIIYLAATMVWCMISIICGIRKWLRFKRKKFKFSVLMGLVLLVIAFQSVASSAYTHMDDDDAYYVATAVTAVATNTIADYNVYTGQPDQNLNLRYVLSPYPIYLAVISEISGVHAATLAHILYPAVFIPMAYGCYYLLAVWIFWKTEEEKRQEKVALMLLTVSVITMFGGYSGFSMASFLLLRIWQGKAVICSIMMPFLIMLFLRQNYRERVTDWIAVFLTVTAMSTLSGMGIFLAPFLIGILALISFWEKRKWNYLVIPAFCILPCLGLGVVYLIAK